MKQQSHHRSTLKEKHLDSASLMLVVRYQPIIFSNQSELKAMIFMKPKRQLINTPLQVQLRGYSHMQAFNQNLMPCQEKSVQVTDDFINETEQKLQVNVLMGQSNKFDGKSKPKLAQINEMNQDDEKKGEYFLEGCHVLYQINQQTGQRLQSLQKRKTYQYPLTFTLPPNLPVSVDNIVLQDIHITIKYSLEVKVISVDKQFGKKENMTLIIPFQIQQPQKQYPYQVLVAKQLIRLYHVAGKRKDELMNRACAKLIDCICPHFLYDKYLHYHNHYKTKFKVYDLFHLELLVVVNKDSHIFLIVRSYQQPEAEKLTQNREKAENKPVLKEVNSMGDVPNDISLVSMKHTQRKQQGIGLCKVQVEMLGQLVNICKQSIFKKIITLNQSNYDMIEGEIMVNLKEYMPFPRSCNNELFVLKYSFVLTAFFGEEERESTQHESFVVESVHHELII